MAVGLDTANPQQETSYQPIAPCGGGGGGSDARSSSTYHDDSTMYHEQLLQSSDSNKRRMRWVVAVLSALLVATNIGWLVTSHQQGLWASMSRVETTPAQTDTHSCQLGLGREEEDAKTYPPQRTILQPIYQDTEFNEEKNSAREDFLWKGLFPDGNGVISLNKTEAKAHGLHDTAADPNNENNALYIIGGFHTMHCLTVLRTSLHHFYAGENQTAPWSHMTHCLDMIRQTLMCNMDTTLMWLHDPDNFADGQLHVCKDFWQLHQWASRHAG